ncbi:hypothetical protein O0L34_g10875 [Tuta absoluta]|nr:hypothetical protein O0L34_g10875 [Tuta absoluta]
MVIQVTGHCRHLFQYLVVVEQLLLQHLLVVLRGQRGRHPRLHQDSSFRRMVIQVTGHCRHLFQYLVVVEQLLLQHLLVVLRGQRGRHPRLHQDSSFRRMVIQVTRNTAITCSSIWWWLSSCCCSICWSYCAGSEGDIPACIRTRHSAEW